MYHIRNAVQFRLGWFILTSEAIRFRSFFPLFFFGGGEEEEGGGERIDTYFHKRREKSIKYKLPSIL